MSATHRGRVHAAVFAVLVAIVASLTACGTSSDAGGNFRLSADQLSPTTTQPPLPVTTTATATGEWLDVFASKPTENPAVASATPASFTAATVQPIPRPGLGYEFAQSTFTGWRFKNPTFFGNPLVMVVTAIEGEWVKVSIPARPNGQQGWARLADVSLAQHHFHAELILSQRLFTVWDGNTPVAQTNVVVGTDNTPTPVGTTYIAERITAAAAGVNPGGAYGPWILATSSYSETLEQFDGGLPVIAFHGTNSPGLIGSAVSNGCVRMPNEVVTLLAETIPPGTPVTVTP